MGGILIIISVVVPTLLWANLRNPYVWIALFGMASFGLIGFFDDYAKIRGKQNKGLTVREKFCFQVVAALDRRIHPAQPARQQIVFHQHQRAVCQVLQARPAD